MLRKANSPHEGGYLYVLKIALPLIISTSSWTVQQYVDRMFLSWFDTDAFAASLPAGLLNFTVASFFIGLAGYVNTFVAQYQGAGRPERIGPSVWQGIYLAILAGLAGLAIIPLAEPIFNLANHAPEIRKYEVEYFSTLCWGIGVGVGGAAASSFYSGRGQTIPLMWVNFVITGVNIALDYALIFGHWGLPAWGIRGAAWATVIAQGVGFVIYMALLFQRPWRERYGTLTGWRLDRDLFSRLIRFGLPNGVQFMLDILGFAFFMLLVGRLAPVELKSTNLAFNINMLAFMPMIGMAIAVTTLTGQALGANKPGLAEHNTWCAFRMATVYMSSVALLYILIPKVLMAPFTAKMLPEDIEQIRPLTITLLRFVAVFAVFDTCMLVFSSTLKGAGDTRFVMLASIITSWLLMVTPTWFFCIVMGKNLYWAWTWLTLYVVVLGLLNFWRFKRGKWKSMRVIEPHPPAPPSMPPPEVVVSEV